jgi:hypothetical protein
MNLEKVIQTGESISAGFWEAISTVHAGWLWLLLIAGMIGLFIYWVCSVILETYASTRRLSILITFSLVVVLGGYIMVSLVQYNMHLAKIETWKTEVAYPYIEALELKKSEIVYIKISPQIEYTTIAWRGRYISSDKLQPLTLSYKATEESLRTMTDWYDASMSLSDSELPYVEYRHLNRDLPNGISAGDYYPKVYLPKHYKFTDIK